jgi:hypothetical protein
MRARARCGTQERHGDDVSRDVDLTGLEKERILGDQADIAMAMQVRWCVLIDRQQHRINVTFCRR